MAEVAATAIGIAGVVSVLQNLLQFYKDFTTARDFPRSLTTLMLQAALIDNSTRSWAEAVGLIDHSGAPLNTFLINHPTENNAKLAARTLAHIQEIMSGAIKALERYQSGPEVPAREDVQSNSAKEEENDTRRRKILRKLSKAHLCTRTQEGPSMGLRRVTWAFLDKESLEKKLAEVTTLLDRLNTDFRPKNPEMQMMVYHSSLQGLGIENEDMQILASLAVDKVSRSVAAFIMKGQAAGTTGSIFERIVLNNQAMLHQGNFVAPDYVISGAENLLASKNTFKIIEGSDQCLISIGNQYGGKSSMEMMHERMAAAMTASLAMETSEAGG